jgi:predicted peptidase
MKAIFATFAALFLGVASTGAAGTLFDGKSTGTWEKLEFNTLKLRFYAGPALDGAKTYPLVIFLHGRGSGGKDNEKQLGSSAKSFSDKDNYSKRPCIILVPQCPDDKIGWLGTTQDDLIKLIKLAAKTLPVDSTRIYLTGLSMGGFGTWFALAREPELFAAAVPVCGGGDPGKAQAISNIPIWAFHGAADDVVAPSFSQKMVAALKKVNGKVKYTELPGVKHNAWDTVYADQTVHEWLFNQHRG